MCTCDQGACAELQRQGGVHRGLMDAGRRAPGRGEVTRSREASVLDQDAQVRLNLTIKIFCDIWSDLVHAVHLIEHTQGCCAAGVLQQSGLIGA